MNIPKISAYFITYNSEIILPHLLKHYSKFCTKITIIDNCSTDSTPDICEKFHCNYIKYDTKETFNDGTIAVIKNTIWKKDIGQFDYVIVGDNDEFLCHDSILTFIQEKEKLGYTIFKPTGYHMVGDYNLVLNENDNIFEKVKYGYRIKSMDKPILFNCNKIQHMGFSVGCHECCVDGIAKIYYQKDFVLKHFKFLGLKLYLAHCRNLKSRLSQFNKKHELGLYYLEDDEYHIKDYKYFFDNRTLI